MIPSDESRDGFAPATDADNQLGTDYFHPHPMNEFPDPDRPTPGYPEPMTFTLPDGRVITLPAKGHHAELVKPRMAFDDEQELTPEEQAQAESGQPPQSSGSPAPGAPPAAPPAPPA